MPLLPPRNNEISLVEEDYHPGLSVDCVIFGFHDYQLKVLLLEARYTKYWALAGGFVLKEEDVNAAAGRVLEARTGLTNIFLQQFHLFGNFNRVPGEITHPMFTDEEFKDPGINWVGHRFVTAGYYALVDYTTVEPHPDNRSDICAWWEVNDLPPLILDHQAIIDKALETLRLRLRHEPIGYNLLPEKFTMAELQKLYEAILGRTLDRRNFHRRILSFGILKDLKETRHGMPYKAPRLYSFDPKGYKQALEQGLRGGW